MSKTTTVTQLRNEMLNVFDGLRAGTIQPAEAKELSNASGKIINSAKLQLEYMVQRKEKPEIDFIK
jgi:hypothetical protein